MSRSRTFVVGRWRLLVGAPLLSLLLLSACASSGARHGFPGEVQAYAERLSAAVRQNVKIPVGAASDLRAEVLIEAERDGRIKRVSLQRSSGHPEWDKEALRAVQLTKTLPLMDDGTAPAKLVLVMHTGR